MSQIGALIQFVANTKMKSADVNQNFTDCKNGHNGARQLLAGVAFGGMPAAVTRYLRFGSSAFQATERSIPVPFATTFSLLTVRLDAAQPADGSLVVTLRKNGVDTALTIVVAAGAAAGTYQDAAHTVDFAAGDRYSLSVVNNSPGTVSPLRSYALAASLKQIGPLVAFAPSVKVSAADLNGDLLAWKAAHEASRYMVLSSLDGGIGGQFVGPGCANVKPLANQTEWIAPIAGTLSDFWLYAGVSGAGQTVTLYVNGVATALTVLTDATALGSDLLHTVAVNAGDRITLTGTQGEGYAFCFRPAVVGALVTFAAGVTRKSADANANFAALQAAHNAERVPGFVTNLGHIVFQVGAGATVFVGPSLTGGIPGTESQAEVVVPFATTLRNLAVLLGNLGAQPASGNLVFTLRKNGADTALTVTFAANTPAESTQLDNAHNVAIAAGDRVCVKIVNNAAAPSAGIGSLSLTSDL